MTSSVPSSNNLKASQNWQYTTFNDPLALCQPVIWNPNNPGYSLVRY